MGSQLIELWRSNTAFFAQKSCAQIVGLAGNGKLKDGSSAANEFRELLNLLPSDQLRRFAQECLSDRFEDSGFALQDIVNEIGTRLGFLVEPGRYRGVKNQVGFDGIWRSQDQHALLVEVKTTDAYRINLDTIARYRRELIESNDLQSSNSSMLLTVGREDTGDMEAQIRGSRHAWDIRVVSIDALLRLLTVKEQMSDWGTSSQINLLLRPLEYTRIDGIVDLLFATTKDIEPEDQDDDSDETSEKAKDQQFDHDASRKHALKLVEAQLGTSLKKKGRVFWSTADGSANVVCLSSQPYNEGLPSQSFWYGVKPGQRRFLEEAPQGFAVFAFGPQLPPAMIEKEEFFQLLAQMKTTPPSPSADSPLIHWHVSIFFDGGLAHVNTPLAGNRTNITEFIVRQKDCSND